MECEICKTKNKSVAVDGTNWRHCMNCGTLINSLTGVQKLPYLLREIINILGGE